MVRLQQDKADLQVQLHDLEQKTSVQSTEMEDTRRELKLLRDKAERYNVLM